MPFATNDKNLSHIAKMLPPEALASWCKSATEAEELGLEHNECVRAGWDEVNKNFEKPSDGGRKWIKKAGARNNKTDAQHIQDMHDKSVELGAKCEGHVAKGEFIPPTIITKLATEDNRMVYGWASVISYNGVPHADTQGDVIEPEELLKATEEFMTDVRHAAHMHARDENGQFCGSLAIGQVVHSFPITAELAKSLGIDTDKEGWIVGVKVHDDAIWQKVKSGELPAFSIGGHGNRVLIED